MNTTHAKSVSHSFSIGSAAVSNSFLTHFMTIQLKRKHRKHNTAKKDKANNNKFLHKHKQINSECKYAEKKVYWDIELLTVTLNAVTHLTWQWRIFLDCKLTLLSILRFLFQSTALTGLGPHGQKALTYMCSSQLHDFQSCPEIFLYWFSRTGEVNHGNHASSGLTGHGLLMLVQILPGPYIPPRYLCTVMSVFQIWRAYEIYAQYHISARFIHLVVLCTRKVLQWSAALCSNRPAKI